MQQWRPEPSLQSAPLSVVYAATFVHQTLAWDPTWAYTNKQSARLDFIDNNSWPHIPDRLWYLEFAHHYVGSLKTKILKVPSQSVFIQHSDIEYFIVEDTLFRLTLRNLIFFFSVQNSPVFMSHVWGCLLCIVNRNGLIISDISERKREVTDTFNVYRPLYYYVVVWEGRDIML